MGEPQVTGFDDHAVSLDPKAIPVGLLGSDNSEPRHPGLEGQHPLLGNRAASVAMQPCEFYRIAKARPCAGKASHSLQTVCQMKQDAELRIESIALGEFRTGVGEVARGQFLGGLVVQ